MANTKVLITGASGLLGRELYKQFRARGWDCTGLAHSRARGELLKVDLCNEEEVRRCLEATRPDVVVHSAAERRPNVVASRPEAATELNVEATERLARLCRENGSFLLYISTDYVFDGRAAPYLPSAPTNPLNEYGRSKLAGEKAVMDVHGSGNAVLRVPVLYGDVEKVDESAVTVLLNAVLDTSKRAQVLDYEKRYPTHVRDVSRVCAALVQEHEKAAGSVWHFSARECLTKYGMACVIAKVFGLPHDHLEPVEGPVPGPTRPYDSHLDSHLTEECFGPMETIPFKQGIREALHTCL